MWRNIKNLTSCHWRVCGSDWLSSGRWMTPGTWGQRSGGHMTSTVDSSRHNIYDWRCDIHHWQQLIHHLHTWQVLWLWAGLSFAGVCWLAAVVMMSLWGERDWLAGSPRRHLWSVSVLEIKLPTKLPAIKTTSLRLINWNREFSVYSGEIHQLKVSGLEYLLVSLWC